MFAFSYIVPSGDCSEGRASCDCHGNDPPGPAAAHDQHHSPSWLLQRCPCPPWADSSGHGLWGPAGRENVSWSRVATCTILVLPKAQLWDDYLVWVCTISHQNTEACILNMIVCPIYITLPVFFPSKIQGMSRHDSRAYFGWRLWLHQSFWNLPIHEIQYWRLVGPTCLA